MCGISGFCDFSLNYYDKKPFWETILVQMHETLKHRGPDQAMIDLQPHVGLSHARLSIRDLKSGIQPMTRTFHGKTCSIVYNGEIYNHRELLPELQAAGYRFTTTSDTEIILCAYMHFGKNFVEKLNGIFAFAIWDDTNRELLLYRDRAGTKPLFYTQTGSSFVFGSEPKALFCHPDVTPSIDQNSLYGLGIGIFMFPAGQIPVENVVLSVRTEYMIMSRHNFLYACEYAVSGGACRTDRQNFLQTVLVNGWSDIRMTK